MNTTPLALAEPRYEAKPEDRDIARLLAKRYGDGTVYLPSGGAMGLYHTCMALGFVSTEHEQGPSPLDPL